MASETYDYESFDNTDHTMKQIADAIRHKGYGKDVREAIAQGMEAYDEASGKLFERMQKVEEKNSDLEKRLQKIEQFLFSNQSVNVSAISRDDDNEHQGYEIN